MPTLRTRARLSLIGLVVALACGDGTGSSGPPPTPGPLESGPWYLHTANGDPLPAKISERIVGVALEETFVDSARIDVDLNAGTWEQRYWIRVLVTGVLDRQEVVIDFGDYAIGPGMTYLFTSDVRTRSLVIGSVTSLSFVSTEPMLFYVDAPDVTGLYRTTPP